MGRRSQHKPEELRQLILDAAHRIVEANGVSQLSAREIARAIDYAPGTLYNMYQNLDEILLRVQVRLLNQLDDRLARDMDGAVGADAVRCFAGSFVAFAHAQPRLWSLLGEHVMPAEPALPVWFVKPLEAPIVRLEPPLAVVMRSNDAKAIRRAARTLWCVVHGMTAMSVCAKFGQLDNNTMTHQVTDVIDAYLTGLAARAAKRSTTSRFREPPPAAPR